MTSNLDLNNLERVYSTGTEYLAELLKHVLTDNGIEAFIINRQDSSYHFGDIEVFVSKSDFEKAKSIREEFEKNDKVE